jgi:hypothetical protein
MKPWNAVFVAAVLAASCTALSRVAQSQVPVKHIQTDASAIATGVWAGDTFYLSGQLASPITLADEAKGTPADYGDTKAQAGSVFAKIQRRSRRRAST